MYSAVSGNERIPTWPVHNPYRWNVLLDAIIVNETITVPTTKVTGAPSNKAVALMDSGASYTCVILPLLYSFVPSKTVAGMHQKKFVMLFMAMLLVLLLTHPSAIGGSHVQRKSIWLSRSGSCHTLFILWLCWFSYKPVDKSFQYIHWTSILPILSTQLCASVHSCPNRSTSAMICMCN